MQKYDRMTPDEKDRLIRMIERDATDNEISHWGCSQVVLDALQRHLGLGNRETFRAATGFAGGVGRSGEACGALLGGVMAIGLAYGRNGFETGKVAMEQPEFLEAVLRSNRLCEKFKEKFGSLRCSDVKAFVRGDGYKPVTRYNTMESFEDHAKCADVTRPAARLAAEIIFQPREQFADQINTFLDDLKQVRKQQKKG